VPAFMIGSIMVVLCVSGGVLYLRETRREVRLEQRGLDIAVFVLSLTSLVISFKLFWNMGVYADEYGSSPVLVSGGWFWLYMDWIRQGLLLVLCIISGLRLIKRSG
jgi:peptidoglycan biosynthesis protein MviN/MurJ (putative lipid II flippase)